ncbi:lipopolysaccharide transport system permease protein [Oryzomicrobium terrae]|uniref:Transport permease protein n=1 Tax=Oryzomicrobium terrae TaxID=1735038 RepID=A0A5C1EBB5_9RHOO|nr:ABC transporter permease [Oryzomicrobium terrae]QEL65869.1 lipopolysaccharide transport system permease protein [Oryzomicrobium terrae]
MPFGVRSFISNRYLITQLIRREILLKYRGSLLGISWSFLHPLLVLGAYVIALGPLISDRWGLNGSHWDTVLFVYCGLSVFSPFAEVIAASPRLLQNHQSYVKKIIFPTEVLSVVTTCSAVIHGLVSLFILTVLACANGHWHPALLALPLLLLPAWLFILGISWLLCTAGAFIRDVSHAMPVITQLALFLSPVFYPTSAMPKALQVLQSYNPLAVAMEQTRGTVLRHSLPSLESWSLMLLIGSFIMALGLASFNSAKEDFADVL